MASPLKAHIMPLSERVYNTLNESNALQRFICRKIFNAFQLVGAHVTGNHFYEVIPDTRRVAHTYRDEPRELPGVDFQFNDAEGVAVRLVQTYGREFHAAASNRGYVQQNRYFRALDALLLYCWTRDLKPRRVVEVGQGFSTRVVLSALERNATESALQSTFISIDPYSRYRERVQPEGIHFVRVREELQTLDIASAFGDVDFVFIDSSHVYKFGSDVEFEFERLYPSLPVGVTLHVHDIFSPYHYPKEWIVQQKIFWNEQYHLENFLRWNRAFRIVMPVHYLARRSKAFATACKNAHPQLESFFGSSFYMQRIA
jgi:predicted O-methyltransferase YrrM